MVINNHALIVFKFSIINVLAFGLLFIIYLTYLVCFLSLFL